MSQRIITLDKTITEITGQGTHRLQMWVSFYQDIDPKIFVYQRRPAIPPATADIDEYVNIASAADLVEYPEDNPDTLIGPFFRLSSIDLLFRSVDLMNKSIDTMEKDVQNLIINLDYLEDQGNGTTTQFTVQGQIFP